MATTLMPDPTVELRERFARLAAATPREEQHWRAAAAPFEVRGEYVAFYVVFVNVEHVRDVLDREFMGAWTVVFGPPLERRDTSGKLEKVVMKATLTVAGVIREAFGSGKDEKAAESDALKRAARHFGVANDLYRFDKNYVPVDGPQRGARPKIDPGEYYWRTQARKGKATTTPAEPERGGSAAPSPRVDAGGPPPGSAAPPPVRRTAASSPPPPAPSQKSEFTYAPVPCPTCKSRMWDNRLNRRPNSPAFRCTRWKSHGCTGVVWADQLAALGLSETPDAPATVPDDGFPPPLVDEVDDLPF